MRKDIRGNRRKTREARLQSAGAKIDEILDPPPPRPPPPPATPHLYPVHRFRALHHGEPKSGLTFFNNKSCVSQFRGAVGKVSIAIIKVQGLKMIGAEWTALATSANKN
jgi:hypothetical protein